MKSFLKYTLASVLGFFIVIIASVFIMSTIVSLMVSSTKKDVVIKENSMLQLKLNYPIVDRAPNDPFQDLEIPGFQGNKKLGLNKIISAIEKAANDDNIKGVYLRTDMIPSGIAALEEIRNALVDFKESGKFIYAYSESYSQKAYYVASVSDKIFLNPEGMVMFNGLSATPAFFKGALDKLGIEMQVIRHGKFKAAVEPFIREDMSEANKKQVKVYINSIWSNTVQAISESRGISVDELNKIADQNMMFSNAEKIYSLGLIDSVLYEDQVLDFLRDKMGIKENKGIPVASISDMKSSPKLNIGKGFAKEKIAVIYAQGEINVGGSSSMNDEAINSRKIAKEIRKARQDSMVKAVVLRVNSPGGSSLGSELIWREVKLTKAEKPMIVSMGNLAASGGYYISCSADSIVANPTTITGSIGVFGLIPNIQELMEDKLGITTDVVKTNELSDMLSINRPMTENEKMLMQNMVEEVYATFVNHVSEGRGLTYEQVDEIGQGRVWTGENALELGLVDKLGDLNDAIDIAISMADLDHYRIVELPKQKDPIQELLEGFSTKVKMNVLKQELGPAAKYYQSIEYLKNTKGIMARIPYDVQID